MKPCAPLLRLKTAISGRAFFSPTMAMDSVPAMLELISTGTTAPFSAMSGALTLMSPEGDAPLAPIVPRAPPKSFDSKPALFQSAANTAVGFRIPAATATLDNTGPAGTFQYRPTHRVHTISS
jgi:hypothetical protein